MKRLIVILLGLVTLIPTHADEGMWMLYDLPEAVYNQMKGYGFEASYDRIYNSDDAIMRSVVLFGGFCSGVVVSPDGLVFTNHHCGFGAIRNHSTVDNDIMLNGFYAKSFDEELPNKDLFVSFMKSQQDVTDILKAKGIDYKSREDQENLIMTLQNELNDSVKNIDKTLHVEIDAYYEGNKYYATTYQMFPDVRLVFTVPKSMGKFGGDTDNWMWPRQTCDFSVFRIYAAPKTNAPAEYSKENVPYHPKTWAQVSLKGYKDGDYAMTMGYPGSTKRYLSSYGIKEMRDASNAPRAQVRGIKLDIMRRHMQADAAVRIKYDSQFASCANYWKNSIGMNKCIDSIGIISQKQAYEQRIRKWQDSTMFMKDQFNMDELSKLYEKRFNAVYAGTYFSETFNRLNEILTRALKICRGNAVIGSPKTPKKQYAMFANNSDNWDLATDKEVTIALIKNYREHVSAEYLPDFYDIIDKQFGGDCTAYVDFVFDNSQLLTNNKKLYVNRKSILEDPGMILGNSVKKIGDKIKKEIKNISEAIKKQEMYLCAAKIRMEQDMPHYSDANMTMRLSYGQVKEYKIGGVPSGYYTTAESLVKKIDQGDKIIDYYAEPIMKELLSADDFGKYADRTTGKMQLCFLTTNDITGGNSGSPMFNGKGELIGLAFDGNWDSLSSDIFFDSDLARCIGVDMRFVLFMMDKWGHADRLIDEINAK